MSVERINSKHQLLGAAADILSNDHYLMVRPASPHDDAQAELLDERLLDAAREFVEVHEGVETNGG